MARKKKEITTEDIVVKESISELKDKIAKTIQVVTHNDVYFRTKPFLNDKYLAGKMVKGKIYDVKLVINFSIKKMYLLKEGYYVIADEVKIV
jgi:hypothetical protein